MKATNPIKDCNKLMRLDRTHNNDAELSFWQFLDTCK